MSSGPDMTSALQRPDSVQIYLDDLVRTCAQAGHSLVSVVLFGSAARGASSCGVRAASGYLQRPFRIFLPDRTEPVDIPGAPRRYSVRDGDAQALATQLFFLLSGPDGNFGGGGRLLLRTSRREPNAERLAVV